jgi:hypothetical protein
MHVLESEAPVAFEYVPGTQAVHTAASDVAPVTPDHVPAGHRKQVSFVTAAVAFENVPALHDTHVATDEAPGATL